MDRVSSDLELTLIPGKKKILSRPPSYSDSFFFLPTDIEPLKNIDIQVEDIQSPTSQLSLQIQPNVSLQDIPPKYHLWITKIISIGLHVSLLSIFETVFFFQFISKEEDNALETTIGNYIGGVIHDCSTWPNNITQVVNDILILFINSTNIENDANESFIDRRDYDKNLQIQAWMYVIGLISFVSILSVVARIRKIHIYWKKIFIENLILIILLGLYEYFFFKTIIYNYKSLSFSELNGYIVSQLQDDCGLFNS